MGTEKLTAAERREKIERIRNLPARIEAAVKGLNDAQLDTPYRAGGWTVRQVVHHLVDSHVNAFVRTKLILTENHPTLKPYNQDDWAKLADTSLPVDSSLTILRGLHERWAILFDHVPDGQWSRTGLHPEDGELSLDRILAMYADHGEKHLGHILTLRRAKAW